MPITPAPDPVPPAPLRGKSFVLADGRTFIIPPPTLAQVHGQCALSFSTIVNVIAAEQWGVAIAVEQLAQHVYYLIHAAMSRNYEVDLHCDGALGKQGEDGKIPTPCSHCVACLLDLECVQPVLLYLTEVSGYRELLKLVGVRPATASLDASGTSTTIN
jgi:hypothetical protein